ncbi:MAG: YaiI/YqxD family protein [Rhizomicrobium sp.]
MPEIFVDADACPVKAEVERVAERHGFVVHIVSNGGIRPNRHPLFRHVTVAEGPDAADDWIAEHVTAGDIVVTADIPLASRCLKKRARVLGPTGKVFTEATIGLALGMRDFNKYLREASGNQTYNAAFRKEDRSQFLNALENEIQAAKRLKPITNAELKTMREEKVQITTADGVADGFLYLPGGKGPWPAILHYPDGIGIRPAFHQMAKRLRGEGYAVLLPNIYYRTTSGPAFDFTVDFSDPKTRQRFGELTAPLTQDAMERDALAYLDCLGARSEAKGAFGVVGFCLTGKMALYTAAAAPARIAAAAAFHGGGLYTDDAASPHHVLPRIKARLYFGHAIDDNSMPADAIAKFEAALAAWGGVYESETYPARHGWTVPGWEIYDEAQAERAYAKMKALFAETLR